MIVEESANVTFDEDNSIAVIPNDDDDMHIKPAMSTPEDTTPGTSSLDSLPKKFCFTP